MLLPATPPAMVLAVVRSLGVGAWTGVDQARKTRLRVPQYVVPRANHCRPDAKANRAAGLLRMMPAVPPTMRPAKPGLVLVCGCLGAIAAKRPRMQGRFPKTNGDETRN